MKNRVLDLIEYKMPSKTIDGEEWVRRVDFDNRIDDAYKTGLIRAIESAEKLKPIDTGEFGNGYSAAVSDMVILIEDQLIPQLALEREGGRVCSSCKDWKPLNEFHRNVKRRLGREYRCKPCMYEKCKKWRSENKEKYNQLRYKNNRKHPEKMLARNAVTRAVKKGTLLKQPCEVCGETKVEAHHEDYSKPLDVKWVCIKHHAEIHHGK